MTPPIIQAPSTRAVEPVTRAISLDTRKTPVPIVSPMTMAVAESRLRPRTRSDRSHCCSNRIPGIGKKLQSVLLNDRAVKLPDGERQTGAGVAWISIWRYHQSRHGKRDFHVERTPLERVLSRPQSGKRTDPGAGGLSRVHRFQHSIDAKAARREGRSLASSCQNSQTWLYHA